MSPADEYVGTVLPARNIQAGVAHLICSILPGHYIHSTLRDEQNNTILYETLLKF